MLTKRAATLLGSIPAVGCFHGLCTAGAKSIAAAGGDDDDDAADVYFVSRSCAERGTSNTQ